MASKVCRLCSSTDNLTWVFDGNLQRNLTEIIHESCGVEISKTDVISQMICDTCYQITIKIHQFRLKTIKNDKELKARYAESSTTQVAPVKAKNTIKSKPTIINNITVQKLPSVLTKKSKPKSKIPKHAHPSVKEILMKYPEIKLPKECFTSHVGVYITLLKDEVDDWFREKQYTELEIEQLKKEALKSLPKDRSDTKRKIRSEKVNEKLDNQSKRIKLSNELTEKIKKVNQLQVETREMHSLEKEVVGIVKEKVTNPETVIVDEVPSSSNENKPVYNICKIGKDSKSSEIGNSKVDNEKKKSQTNDNYKKLLLEMLKEKDSDSCSNNESDSISKPTVSEKPSSNACEKPQSIVSSVASDFPTNCTVADSEEITLTSILKSVKPCIEDDDIIEIIGPILVSEKQNNNTSSNKRKKSEEGVNTESTPQAIHGIEKQSNGNNTATSAKVDQNSPKKSLMDKTAFAEALELTPRSAEISSNNQPDLSLVSVIATSRTLYTCKVCDSHHSSLKELRLHQKTTHTRCPFCRKRFRTSVLRDEHIKQMCPVHNSSVKLKDLRLVLTRVDEDEKIKKQYASAFSNELEKESDSVVAEEKNNSAEDNVTTPAKILENTEVTPSTEIVENKIEFVEDAGTITPSKEILNNVSEIIDTIKYLENPSTSEELQKKVSEPVLDAATDTEVANKNTSEPFDSISNAAVALECNQTNTNDDIIYISDEESEIPANNTPQPPKSEESKINVVNSDILTDINIHDNDINVLASLIKKLKTKPPGKDSACDLKNNPIIDGGSSRTKIFKNLVPYLKHHKIPIQIEYSPDLKVEYKRTTTPQAKKRTLWHDLVPQQLKTPAVPKKQTPYSTATPTFKIINSTGGNKLLIGPTIKPATSQIKTAPSNLTSLLLSTKSNLANTSSPNWLLKPNTNYILVPNSMLPKITFAPQTVLQTITSTTAKNSNITTNSSTTATVTLCTAVSATNTTADDSSTNKVAKAVTNTAIDQPSSSTVARLESITNSLMPKSTNNEPIVSVSDTAASSTITSVPSTSTSKPASNKCFLGAKLRVKTISELS